MAELLQFRLILIGEIKYDPYTENDSPLFMDKKM